MTRTIIIDGQKRTEVLMQGPVKTHNCGYSNDGETYGPAAKPGFWKLLPEDQSDEPFAFSMSGSFLPSA